MRALARIAAAAYGVTLMLSWAPAASAQLPVDRMKPLVVMLKTTDGSGKESCSAGIIVSQTPERTLILTARHIRVKVAEELRDDANAPDILPYLASLRTSAEFAWLPGETFPAQVVPDSDDADLDYALLSVKGGQAPVLPDLGLLATLGPSEDGERRDRGVVAMGNPACRRWDHTVTPGGIKEKSPAIIKAESSIDEEGLSGGALFGADGTLVGMVQRSGSGFVYARPITLLIGELRRRSFRVDLTQWDRAPADLAGSQPAGPSMAMRFNRNLVRAHLDLRTQKGFGFRIRPGLGANGLTEFRFSGSSTRIIPKSASYNFEQFIDLTAREALTEPLAVTLAFEDGSTIRDVSLDVRSPVQALMDRLRDGSERWGWGFNGHRSFQFGLSEDARKLISHIEFGMDPKSLAYRILPAPPATGREVTDIVSGENLVIPLNYSKVWYRITFIDGTKTAVQSIDRFEERCVATNDCPNDGPLELQPITQGAPPISYRLSVNFPPQQREWFKLELPPTLRQHRVEIDPDGRGVLPLAGWLGTTGERIRLRFTGKDGSQIGPFDYRVDLATPALLGAQGGLKFGCAFDWNSMQEYCFVANLQAVYRAKEIRLGVEPGKWVAVLRPNLTAGQIADRSWRKSVDRCHSAVYQPRCLAAWLAAGAAAPIPKDATDLYVAVEWRNGTREPATRLPHTPRR